MLAEPGALAPHALAGLRPSRPRVGRAREVRVVARAGRAPRPRGRARASVSSFSPAAVIGRPHQRRDREAARAPLLQTRRSAPRRGRRAVVRRGTRRLRTVPPSCAPSPTEVPSAQLHAPPHRSSDRRRSLPRCRGSRRSRVERGTILEEFVEKSDTLRDDARRAAARSASCPDVPSAYTQPLYALVPRRPLLAVRRARGSSSGSRRSPSRWRPRSLVLAIGRRLGSTGTGVVAALVTTLHPYLVWHDVHVNREILDGLLARRRSRCSRCSPTSGARSSLAAATGAVAGLAILGNARLALLPLVVGAVRRLAGPAGPASASVCGAVVVVGGGARRRARGSSATRSRSGAPRSRPTPARSGRRTTRTPATCSPAAAGSTTCPSFRACRRGPSRRRISLAGGRAVDECAQMRLYREEVLDVLARAARREGPARRPGGRDALVAVPDRGGREPASGLARTAARRTVEPAVHGRSLRSSPSGRLFLAPAALRRAGRCSCSPTTRCWRWCSRGRCATARRGTSCSRSSRPSRSSALWRARACERALARGRRAQRGRAPRSARCTAPGGTPERARRARRAPIAAARVGSPASSTIACASASTSPGGTSRPVPPSSTISGKPADRARDHRPRRAPSPRARPCRTPRRATGRRRSPPPRSRRCDRRDAAEEANRVVEPELARVARERRLERARAGDVERRRPGLRARACASARSRTQWPLIGISRPTIASRGASRRTAPARARLDAVVDDLEVAPRRTPRSRRGSGRDPARSRCGRPRASRPRGRRRANTASLAERVEAVLRARPAPARAPARPRAARRSRRARGACGGSRAVRARGSAASSPNAIGSTSARSRIVVERHAARPQLAANSHAPGSSSWSIRNRTSQPRSRKPREKEEQVRLRPRDPRDLLRRAGRAVTVTRSQHRAPRPTTRPSGRAATRSRSSPPIAARSAGSSAASASIRSASAPGSSRSNRSSGGSSASNDRVRRDHGQARRGRLVDDLVRSARRACC